MIDAGEDKNHDDFEECVDCKSIDQQIFTETVHAFSAFCDLVAVQPECPCECLAPYVAYEDQR